MHVKNSWWSTSNFQDLLKTKSNDDTAKLYSPAMRMLNLIIKDNYFVSLKRMETTENAADTNCLTN